MEDQASGPYDYQNHRSNPLAMAQLDLKLKLMDPHYTSYEEIHSAEPTSKAQVNPQIKRDMQPFQNDAMSLSFSSISHKTFQDGKKPKSVLIDHGDQLNLNELQSIDSIQNYGSVENINIQVGKGIMIRDLDLMGERDLKNEINRKFHTEQEDQDHFREPQMRNNASGMVSHQAQLSNVENFNNHGILNFQVRTRTME